MVVFSFREINHVLPAFHPQQLFRQKKLSANPGRYMACICMDLSLSKERGKSGQRRASHHLTDGSCLRAGTESVTETKPSRCTAW